VLVKIEIIYRSKFEIFLRINYCDMLRFGTNVLFDKLIYDREVFSPVFHSNFKRFSDLFSQTRRPHTQTVASDDSVDRTHI